MKRGVSVQDSISCAATHGHVFLHTVSTLRDSAAPADEESDVKYADLDSLTALQELVTQQQQDQERLIGTVAHISNEVEINKEHIKVETFYLSWVYIHIDFFCFCLATLLCLGASNILSHNSTSIPLFQNFCKNVPFSVVFGFLQLPSSLSMCERPWIFVS